MRFFWSRWESLEWINQTRGSLVWWDLRRIASRIEAFRDSLNVYYKSKKFSIYSEANQLKAWSFCIIASIIFYIKTDQLFVVTIHSFRRRSTMGTVRLTWTSLRLKWINVATPQSVWPDVVKNRHFGQILKVFGNFWNLHFALGKLLNLLWQFFVFGQIFIGVSGQILKNIFAIWSHWPHSKVLSRMLSFLWNLPETDIKQRRIYVSHEFRESGFGKISPRWQKSKNILQTFEGLFCDW